MEWPDSCDSRGAVYIGSAYESSFVQWRERDEGAVGSETGGAHESGKKEAISGPKM